MKRSTAIQIIRNLLDTYDQKRADIILSRLELIGMLPPLDPTTEDWNDEASVYKKNYKWEKEDET